MKICIYGLGAIGGLMAAKLGQTGHEVNAIARGKTLAKVRADKLPLRNKDGEVVCQSAVNVYEHPRDAGVQDVVILSVKTTALYDVAANIGPLIGPETLIVSAMNGIPWWFFHGMQESASDVELASVDKDRQVSRHIPAAQVIGCVTHLSAQLPEPGVVKHIAGSQLIIGDPIGGITGRCQKLVELFNQAGFDATASEKIQADIWYKLWGNMTVNPISALTLATADQILDNDHVRQFMSSAMEEAAVIGSRIGIEINEDPEARHQVTRKLGAFKTSMLQDVESGKPLEVEALMGSVLDIARHVGVDAPNVRAIYGLTSLFARNKGLLPK